MTKKSIFIFCILLIFLAPGSIAYGILINFEDTGLPEGDALLDRIAGVSFSNAILAEVGGDLYAFNNTTTSLLVVDTATAPFDNGFFITDALGEEGEFDSPTGPIILEFVVPVANLSFYIADIDGAETMVAKTFTDNGNTLIETIHLSNGGDGLAVRIAFTQPNIRCLTIDVSGSHSIGFGVDNIQFTPAPVPEPATMLLLASGLVGLAGLRRKFRK